MNQDNKQQIDNHEKKQVDEILTAFITDDTSKYNLNTYFFIMLGFISALIIWSLITTIDQTVDIQGQIVPQGGIAVIKHEAGGEVLDINVINYQQVKKGDNLLKINNKKILTGLKQYKSKLKVVDSELALAVAFLKNNINQFSDNNEFKQVESYLNNISDTIEQSQQLAEASKLASDHKEMVIQQQINMNKIEISRLNADIQDLKDQLSFIDEQRNIFNELLKSKNVSKIRALDYEIRYREILRELKKAKSDLESKDKETNELESKKIVQKQDSIKEKYEELVKLNKEKIDLVSNIAQLESSLENLDITAPIDGIVQGINIVKGVTIQPGEEVLSIIPSDSNMVFEAEASLEQKGKIHVENNAEIQFDGFNVLQFNRVNAEIINISPYTFNENTTGNQFFKVVAKLKDLEVKSKSEAYDIKAGMSGTLYISTGKQSLFSYLFGPIYNAFAHVYDQKS